MASNKTKVTLNIDKTVWGHFKAVSDHIPNVSASQLIEEWMRLQTPIMERMVAAVESGESRAVVNLGYVEMGKLFAQLDSVRRESDQESEVENR